MRDDTHPKREAELGRAFGRGEPDAVREVRERLVRIVGYRGFRFSPETRADLVQEVATELWRAVRRPGFDFDAGFWGFVEVVAARRTIDRMRRARPEIALDDREAATPGGGASATSGPLQAALAKERLRLAAEALSRLPGPCRELIHRHVGLGQPYAELAAALGASEGALRVRMLRCIREARRILADLSAAGGPPTPRPDG